MVLESYASSGVESCRFLVEGQAKNLADRLYGPAGPPAGTSFAEMEQATLAVSGELCKRLLDLLLARQAEAMHRNLPEDLRRCPSCGRDTIARDPEPRLFQCRAAIVEWQEPHRYCGRCRKAFFPQSKMLGIDLGHYSVSLLDLIIYAGANKPSFREASRDLQKMSGQAVHEKQVERLTKRIGLERLAERRSQVEYFVNLPLAERCEKTPEGVEAPGDNQVAVVMADAGMLQVRDTPEKPSEAEEALASLASDDLALDSQNKAAEDADEDDDQDKPPSGRHWREDKVGLALTMQSVVSENDPCPEIPETFLDPKRVAKIVRGLKKSSALRVEEEAAGDPTSADAAEAESEDPLEKAEYKGPKLEKRRVVASRQSWPIFGVMLACLAWMSGFAKAKRKAFVADGARAIWRVWQSRFSSYTPILDFIHAMSYVYAAAKAVGGETTAEGWRLYVEWIRWVWQGNVAAVIEQLEKWQHEHGKPEKGESATAVRSVVAKSLRYLRNNQDKMKYAEYRTQGLPLVSSLVESMVKQISRRVKGTEKFWGEEGAEAILELRADYLSDGEIMENFWKHRQAAATGQRSYRTKSST
jgi:hypothetical protein